MATHGPLELDLTYLGPPVRALCGRFAWSVRAWSWGPVAPDARATDATLELTVALDAPGGGAVRAYDHTRLHREGDDPRWIQPLDEAHAEDVGRTEFYQRRWNPARDARVRDVEWYGALAPTAATRWAGGARQELVAALSLVDDDGMQDWPLEASDVALLAPAIAFYERATHDAARFDAMALALYCFDDAVRAGRGALEAAWFDRVLPRELAKLGHLVADWARLDEEDRQPGDVAAITPQLARIWHAGLVPIELR